MKSCKYYFCQQNKRKILKLNSLKNNLHSFVHVKFKNINKNDIVSIDHIKNENAYIYCWKYDNDKLIGIDNLLVRRIEIKNWMSINFII